MDKFIAVRSVEFWQGISSCTPALSDTIWKAIEKRKRKCELSYNPHHHRTARLRVEFRGETALLAREAVESAK